MLLAFRSLLLLGLVTLLHGSRTGQAVSVKLGQRTGQKDRTVKLILDTKLQPHITGMSASTIANMSLSPWTYRDSCVESRFPSRISHAHCLTSGCLSLQGGGEDLSLEAKPIYYQVLVLHRVQKEGRNNNKGGRKGRKYAFRLGTETIPVGCTCVRPSVVPQ
ncbi:interleukin 17a/f3 [Centroberyx gerrardi]